jgi:basic amino acid/polyamine antiporter, APA family
MALITGSPEPTSLNRGRSRGRRALPALDSAPRHVLGIFPVVMLVVGAMIGSGIFLVPGTIVALVGSSTSALLVIGIAGFVAVCGALTMAHLSARLPLAGGQYAFLRETVGPTWSRLFGWTRFWVIQTAVLAALSVAFGLFAAFLLDWTYPLAPALLGLGALWMVTGLNLLGLREGTAIQNLLSLLKIGALGFLIVGAFASGAPTEGEAAPVQAVESVWTGFASAALLAAFAYGGITQATYVIAEVRAPARTMPVALIVGCGAVVALYVLTAAAMYWSLGTADAIVIGNDRQRMIATEAASAFLGPVGVQFVALAVALSILGAINTLVLAGPRLFRAAAEEGTLPKAFAKIDARRGVPHYGLWYQAEWASLLVLLGVLVGDSFRVLAALAVFAIWLFHVPTAWGFLRLPPRPAEIRGAFRAPLARTTAVVFLLGGTVLVAGSVLRDLALAITLGFPGVARWESMWALLMVAVGWIVIQWRSRQNRPRAVAPST